MKLVLLTASLLIILGNTLPVNADQFDDRAATMKIDGTSTLHDWTTPVGKVKAKGDLTVVNGELKSVNAMWVQADVLSIKSEKGEDMDEKIYEALKSEKNPKITFNMTSMKSITKPGAEYVVETTGDMTIAGTTKKIDLTRLFRHHKVHDDPVWNG
ncbi:MAG: YceI family protein [Candidatus Kapabacteria bacterium]|nr:YceI family protein [Candidatus Kapabacteria bacterium]